MKTQSRFDLDDWIFQIRNETKLVVTTCPICDGSRKIVLNDGTDCTCPRCYDGTKREHLPTMWRVNGPFRVGIVRVEESAKGHSEEYMCHETGLGSGQLYPRINDLFAARDSAERECEKRNAVEATDKTQTGENE